MQQGIPYTAPLTSTGGTAPVRWAVKTGTLPSGLTLAASTGIISGVPTSSGTFTIGVQASPRSAPSQHAAGDVTLTVSPAPALTALASSAPGGTQGVPYSAGLDAVGGVTPYTWSVSSGSMPPGLSLDPGSGTISGTPAQAGSFPLTLEATDSSAPTPQTVSESLTISIASSPLAVSSSVPAATVGDPYSATVAASGGVQPDSWAITSGNLPSGLSLDPNTGIISGTPTTAGTYPVTIEVTDSSQPQPQTTTADLTLTVGAPPPLSITSTSIAAGVLGGGYRTAIGFTGGTGPYSWSVTSGSLPPGLSLDGSTGAIWGTPTQTGSFQFTVGVTDSSTPAPQTATANLELDVGNPPALSMSGGALPDASQGLSYSATLQATGGSSPYAFSITTGSLPPGIVLDSATGALTGTPTAAGQFSFTVIAEDSSTPTAQTATADVSITVDTAPPPLIGTAALSDGTQGASYSQALDASGGVAPYHWLISAGALPKGLRLDPSSGTITGTALSYGTYNFTVRLADSSQPAALNATQDLSLTINPSPPLAIAGSPPRGTQGVFYDASLTATGGAGPFKWSIASGKLPAGLKLAAGVISGTPTGSGTTKFTLRVSDQSVPTAQTATKSVSITLAASKLMITTTTLPNATKGTSYQQYLSASGGAGSDKWSIASGKLPTGLKLSATGGYIYGTPTATGISHFAVKITDHSTPSPQTATRKLTITVKT